LVWALIRDEKETGISFFLFDSGVDSGDILGQKKISITDEDDIATLMAKIEKVGKDLVQETLSQWISGKISKRSQSHEDREIMPQRSPEDGRIDWKQSARALFNFIRAQTRPYPGAFTDFRGERLYIWKSQEVSSGPEKKTYPVGEIFQSNGQTRVICGDGKELVLNSLSWKGEHFLGSDFAQRFFR
jgi:methionyl-tRNA formyltransferase